MKILSSINTIIIIMKFIKSAGFRCRLTRYTTAAVLWNARHYTPILANNIVMKMKNSKINSESSILRRCFTTDKVDESDDDDVDDDDDDDIGGLFVFNRDDTDSLCVYIF
jgi:hypothetical protein